MCLDKLANFKVDLDENGIGIGWQGFEVCSNDQLESMFHGSKCWDGILPNRWQKDFHHEKLTTMEDEWYKIGFHIWLKKINATDYIGDPDHFTVRQVRFKNVTAVGYQNQCRVVVARERWVVEDKPYFTIKGDWVGSWRAGPTTILKKEEIF